MLLFLKNIILFSSILTNTFDYIFKNYFANESVLFVYYSSESLDFAEELMKILIKSHFGTLEICNLDQVNSFNKTKRSHIENIVILLGDAIPDERQIKMMTNCKSWNSGSKIILITEKINEKLIKNFLEKLWKLTKALNVSIMAINNTSVKFYTLQPYAHHTMEELKIENLFPNKIPKNFNGTILNAITAQAEPYFFIHHDTHDGIEYRAINEISKRYNFRLKYLKLPPGERPWVMKKINGKLTGTFGLIDRLEADILYHGTIIRIDRYEIADIIAVHTVDHSIWALPVHSFIFDWKSLFIIFNIELWILLLIFLILITVTIYKLTKPGYVFYSHTDAFFQVLAQYLNVSIIYRHDGYIYRIFMIILSFYSLILISSYQSSLITFLTTPRYSKQYESLQEAIDDKLIVNMFIASSYNVTDHDFWNKVLIPGRYVFSGNFSSILEVIDQNKTILTRGSDIKILYEQNQFYLKTGKQLVVHKLEELSDFFFVGIFTSKNHPLLGLFRRSVMSLVESGLIGFWFKEIVVVGKRDGGSGEPVSLSLMHLHGVFLVMVFNLSLALVVFVGELLYGKKEIVGNGKKI